MTYIRNPINPSILDGIGHGQLQMIVFFIFVFNNVNSLLWDKYTRMQLIGYGV